jgi:hypothetical protein
MERNRTFAAVTLLTDIAVYCNNTRSDEKTFGRILFRHDGFVPLLRKRLTVTPQTETIVRNFMDQNPVGIKKLPVPRQNMRARKSPKEAQRHMRAAVTGPMCKLCGEGHSSPCHYPYCPLRSIA